VRLPDYDISEQALMRELDALARLFQQADGPGRFNVLCWMAVIVSAFPPGAVQDQAEDRLSGFIACLRLDAAQLQKVRLFREDGLGARPGGPVRPPTGQVA
jgi:hypothetical protein